MARRSLPELCVAVFVLVAFFAAEVPVIPGTSPPQDVHGIQMRDAAGAYVATPAPALLADAHRRASVMDARPRRPLLSVPATAVLLDVPLKVLPADADSERSSSDDD